MVSEDYFIKPEKKNFQELKLSIFKPKTKFQILRIKIFLFLKRYLS